MDNITKQQLYYGQNQHPGYQNYGANGAGLEKARTVAAEAKGKSNAGFIADKFDPMKHPDVIAKSLVYSLLLSIGATQAANWLVKGNVKAGVSHSEALNKSHLSVAGQKFDKTVEKTPILKKMSQGIGNLQRKWKNAKKPRIWNEIVGKYKEGSIAPWDKSKMYQDGKSAEAFGEFYEFLKKAPEDAIKKLDDHILKETTKKGVAEKDVIKKLFADVEKGKIDSVIAGRTIVEKGYLDNVDSKFLNEVELGESGKKLGKQIDKIFGTKPNLHTSLAKAKFFSGMKTKLGPVSRSMNKIIMMIAEGTGGGVLGGKAALLMNVFGFLTAFNAVAKSSHAAKDKKKFLAEQAKQQQQSQNTTQNFGAGQAGKGGARAHSSAEEMTAAVNTSMNDEAPRAGEKVASFMEDFMGFMLGSYIMTFPLGVAMNKSCGIANIARDEKAVKAAAKHMGVQASDKLYQNTVIEYNKALKHKKQADKWIKFLDTGKMPWYKKVLGTKPATYQAKIAQKMKEKMLIEGISEKSTKAELKAALQAKNAGRSKQWFKNTRTLIRKAGKSQLTLKSVAKGNAYNKGKFGERLARYVIQKPLEASAKLLSKGRFTLLHKGFNLRNAFGRFKKVGGGVGRIALVGFVLTVPFRDAFMKLSHKIFGKPTFSQYDEMKGVYEKQKEAAEKVTDAAQAQKHNAKTLVKNMPTHAGGAMEKTIKIPSQEEIAARQAMMQPEPQTPEFKQYANLEGAPEVEANDVRKLDTYSYIPSSD